MQRESVRVGDGQRVGASVSFLTLLTDSATCSLLQLSRCRTPHRAYTARLVDVSAIRRELGLVPFRNHLKIDSRPPDRSYDSEQNYLAENIFQQHQESPDLTLGARLPNVCPRRVVVPWTRYDGS